MGWKVVRIDFTGKPSVDCAFSRNKGHKKLTNGIAYVVVDDQGNERFAGPTCVKKVDNSYDIRLVPDYTKGCFLQGETTHGERSPNSRQIESSRTFTTTRLAESDFERAVKYLTLRCELLSGYRKAQWSVTTEAYDEYKQTQTLSEDTLKLVLNAADGCHPDFEHLSMKRLLPFYTVYRLLQSLDNTNIKTVVSDAKKKNDLFVELFKTTYLSKDALDSLNQLLDTYGFKKLRVRRNLFR
ncbi:hypothetical protein ACSTLX_24515 [Vibrio parahaemolyticus]|uniref:hypothetical protein n=1 Tax=Vibrio parahaemolyticus TaxID=670 RepID=UPI00111ECFB0|nr:hypothetical protein [Vibrio parahaemolyticus]TOG38893.1 hypothetical protein CGJ02_22850 [Vibrio parahaemolyticus]